MSSTLDLDTDSRDQVIDLTDRVREVVADSEVTDGLCVIYCPHTTAGLVINEGFDPNVARDVLAVFDRLVPWHGPYDHVEGNTAAHVKAIWTGTSQTVLVEQAQLVLGQWQRLQFYEFDGPRRRRVLVAVHAAGANA